MPIQIIGKSILGELGFCQRPSKMGDNYYYQLEAITNSLHIYTGVVMTSMSGSAEIDAVDVVFPKVRLLSDDIYDMFDPFSIYEHCKNGIDKFRPGCDFIIWDSKNYKIAATTFSREAPILAFESTSGMKALGVILRPSLMKYGDYLFSSIKEALGDDITVTLVTCNHFNYKEGSIPSIIRELALVYGMSCVIGDDSDSEKNPECYHRGESGNHVVAMW